MTYNYVYSNYVLHMKTTWTDLNLSSLKYFVDSVSLNSLTKAAEVNFVSRPAVSQAIRRLEGSLGYLLLEHKKKHFALTQQGHAFFVKAKLAVENLNKTLDSAAPQGNFRLACSATLVEYVVLPFLKKLESRQELKMDIRIGTSSKVRQLVSEGESSLALLIDDEQTFGFESAVIKRGQFEFQSRSGKLEYPVITTEIRPEVVLGLKAIPAAAPRLQIESWNICRKTAESLGGTCLVPDLISRGPFKKVGIKSFNYEYKVLAITKNKNHLSELERKLFG